jgi:methyl-accepting chemotaxis protein
MCADCDWKGFVKDANDLIEETEQVPPAGAAFAESVTEKIEGMRDWSKENEHVTEKMENALSNMRRGVEKWVR